MARYGDETPEARLRRMAQRMGRRALLALGEIMEGEGQAAVKLAAAREVLDRGHGRPKAGGEDASPQDFTVVVKRFTDPPEEAGGREADA